MTSELTRAESGRANAGAGIGRAGEAGVTAPIAVLVAMALVSLAAAAALGLSYSAASRAVRAAADLVAVSGAQAYSRGADGCAEAARLAGLNRVDLAGCSASGDLIDFVVEVRVARMLGWRLPGLPDQVAATAYAGRVTGLA